MRRTKYKSSRLAQFGSRSVSTTAFSHFHPFRSYPGRVHSVHFSDLRNRIILVILHRTCITLTHSQGASRRWYSSRRIPSAVTRDRLSTMKFSTLLHEYTLEISHRSATSTITTASWFLRTSPSRECDHTVWIPCELLPPPQRRPTDRQYLSFSPSNSAVDRHLQLYQPLHAHPGDLNLARNPQSKYFPFNWLKFLRAQKTKNPFLNKSRALFLQFDV
jgi:hypothetical protein